MGWPKEHLVFNCSLAENYERGGWIVTEVRPGVWSVVNPNARRPETAAKGKAKR